uniref:Uncharacterized protein n=1 Tax=viral metagenome TaxID=1070528 RepID=A0A6C0DF95_9ZZZZ
MEKITKKMVEKMNQQLLEVEEKRKMKNKLQAQTINNEYKNDMLLTDSMLRKQQYNIKVLEKNINNLTMKTILYTQRLTADFCVKYIMNENYASCVEDTFICIGDVLHAQKHLTRASIYEAYNKLDGKYDGETYLEK